MPLIDAQLADATRLLRLGEGTSLVLLESLVRAHQIKLDLIESRAAESLAHAELAYPHRTAGAPGRCDAGDPMMNRAAHLATVLLAGLGACGPADAPEPPADRADPEVAADAGIDIPPTVRRNLGITFATVEARHVARTLRVPGAFELQPLARHEYRMSLPGRVQLLVDQLATVEHGQPLFRFRSPAWPELLHEILVGEQAIASAEAEIEVGQARLTEAQRKLERVRERVAALAQADFKRADLEAEALDLEASLPRLEAEIRLSETRLSNARRTREHALHRAATAAGISERRLEKEVRVGHEMVPTYLTIDLIEVRAVETGVVEALHVTDGSFVEPPAMVLSTVDPEQVRFRALALQADLPLLAEAGEARIVPPPTPGLPHDAGVEAVLTLGLEAHPEERTLTVLATPREHAPWIRPGVAAFLEVVLESTGGPALAVPRSAVVQDGLTHVFFRRDPADPNRAIRVEADLGLSDGRWIVLESGVARGDEVVLDGAYELKLATQQAGGVPAGGHTHADGTFHGDEH